MAFNFGTQYDGSGSIIRTGAYGKTTPFLMTNSNLGLYDFFTENFRSIIEDGIVKTPWSNILSKPTTLEGFGITDAAPAGYGLGTAAVTAYNDWNNYKTTGFFLGNNLPNAPTSGAATWYWVTVIRYTDSYVYQKAVGFGGSAFLTFERRCQAGTWSEWERVAKYADLDTKLSKSNLVPSGIATYHYRDVCAYYYGGVSITGTLKIVLPTSWTGTMLKIVIDGLDRGVGRSMWSVELGGRIEVAGNWAFATATLSQGCPFTDIRFGHDGTKCCILLGTISTIWNTAKVIISDVFAGQEASAAFGSGWGMGIITDEKGIAFGSSPTIYTNARANISVPLTAGKWNCVFVGGGRTVCDFIYYHDSGNNPINIRGQLLTTNARPTGLLLKYDVFSWQTTGQLEIKIVDTGTTKKIYFKPIYDSNLIVNPRNTFASIYKTPLFDLADDDTSGLNYVCKEIGSFINGEKIATVDHVTANAAPAGYGLGTAAKLIIGTDLNSIRGCGFFAGYNMTNSPSGKGWIHLISISNGDDILVQFAHDSFQNKSMYTRYSTDRGTTWQPWVEVAKVVSPAFTGIPTAPTAAAGTNNTQIANTAFVIANSARAGYVHHKINSAKPATDLPSTWAAGMYYTQIYNNGFPLTFGTCLTIKDARNGVEAIQIGVSWPGADEGYSSMCIRGKRDVGADVWGGWTKVATDRASFIPAVDNAFTIGIADHRLAQIFAASATINTSDERAKTDIEELKLGRKVIKSLRAVKFKYRERLKKVEAVEDGTEIVEIEPERTETRIITPAVYETVEIEPAEYETVVTQPEETNEEGNVIAEAVTEEVLIKEAITEERLVSAEVTEEIIIPAKTEERPKYKEVITSLPGVRPHAGFIAQEVRAALEALGYGDIGVWTYDKEADRYGLRYEEITPFLALAIQELDSEVEAQAAKIEAQEVMLNQLTARIEALENQTA
ncbi:tail fiber domain-containing protein|uniref:Chaperone of endosialidase n=1 Tax=Dendrosporobacter quercicolus TaxID=146817 RepID=A0A1G9P180_9FIRM|nr:tail fiber domain-containing protein [Dendrosporobacter quercicolus]NSL47519.1 tail fiber domain-containing protein [Dendrosporobacter quercicolus DSM 1736]SDL92642.1 Chaperone of endosialidase [Dendrosporobacter quercicolus]